MVHHSGQRMLMLPAQRFLEFQVATRRAIHDNGVLARLDADGLDVRKRGFLCVGDVLQQSSSGGNSALEMPATESIQVSRAELSA